MVKSITDVITNSSTEVYVLQAPKKISLEWMAELEKEVNRAILTDRPNSWECIDSTEVLLDKDGHARIILDEHTKKAQEYLLRECEVVDIRPDSFNLLEEKYILSKDSKPIGIREEWIKEEYGD